MASDDNSLLLIIYLSLTCLFSAVQRLEQMIEENITRVMEFILLGFSVQREIEILLFLLILVVYSLTLMGNIGTISLIQLDPHFHTPMYFFLSNLAFVDFCYSSSIVPKFLKTLMTKHRSISFYECVHSWAFSWTSWFWRCSLLQ